MTRPLGSWVHAEEISLQRLPACRASPGRPFPGVHGSKNPEDGEGEGFSTFWVKPVCCLCQKDLNMWGPVETST